mgnify:CR=1 FL=1
MDEDVEDGEDGEDGEVDVEDPPGAVYQIKITLYDEKYPQLRKSYDIVILQVAPSTVRLEEEASS